MLKCTQAGCGRTDGDVGNCGGSHLSCPSLITPGAGVTEVQKGGLDIVIECVPCGITRAFPTARLMSSASQQGRMCRGALDHCQARCRVIPDEELDPGFIPAGLDLTATGPAPAPKISKRTPKAG